MAKRELIDRIHLLAEIKKLQKTSWYNFGKDNMVVSRALYNEREEAVEVVRDLCVNDESAITEQEIVKPYLDKIVNAIDFAIKATDSRDDYGMGMRNGMRYVKSLLDNQEPRYEQYKEVGNYYQNKEETNETADSTVFNNGSGSRSMEKSPTNT